MVNFHLKSIHENFHFWGKGYSLLRIGYCVQFLHFCPTQPSSCITDSLSHTMCGDHISRVSTFLNWQNFQDSPSSRDCGKVIFSVVSVCQSFCPQESHVTVTHDALDLTIQVPLALPTLVTSGDQD